MTVRMWEKDDCPQCGQMKTRRAKLCKACNDKRRGPDHHSWRGGIVFAPDGYVREYAPTHPRANMGRYVPQHVLVMERHLRRFLIPGENVHHRNGVRSDNRIENLELWAVGQPPGQRVTDLVAWAKEILERYEHQPHDSAPATAP